MGHGMKYEMRCECGKAHAVSASDAGALIPCTCGRTVEVPPLHQLRAAAGQQGGAPELALWGLLRTGALPATDECARCGEPTEGTVVAFVECERAEIKKAEKRPSGCLPIGIGFLVFYAPVREPELQGRDVMFHIPVRACPACARELDRGELRTVLRKHPVCAALLTKYPHARVSRA